MTDKSSLEDLFLSFKGYRVISCVASCVLSRVIYCVVSCVVSRVALVTSCSFSFKG